MAFYAVLVLDNPQWQRFAEEYIVDRNASEAYRRAGYTPATDAGARSASAKLFARPEVKAEIARLEELRSVRVGLSAAEVLTELRRLALSDIRKLFHEDGRLKSPHEWDDETAAAVASVETEQVRRLGDDADTETRAIKVKLWDKSRAITSAMDHLGLSKKLTLETVFAILPPELATTLRQAIAGLVPGGSVPPPSAD